jgi:hypothetical protein
LRYLHDVLAGRGEATATTLAVELPVSRQAVVKHRPPTERRVSKVPGINLERLRY